MANNNSKRIPMEYCVSTDYGKFFAISLEIPIGSATHIMFLGTPIRTDADGVHEPMREIMVKGSYLLERLYDDTRLVSIPSMDNNKKEQKSE